MDFLKIGINKNLINKLFKSAEDEEISQCVLVDKKTKKVIDYGVDQFYVYVKGKTKDKKSQELLKIFNDSAYMNLKMFPSLSKAKDNANNLEKGEYMLLYGEDLKNYTRGERAGLKKGREEGRKEGRVEGRKEGRVEGRKEGRVEGRKEAEIFMTLKLIKDGVLSVSRAKKKYGITDDMLKELATIS